MKLVKTEKKKVYLSFGQRDELFQVDISTWVINNIPITTISVKFPLNKFTYLRKTL